MKNKFIAYLLLAFIFGIGIGYPAGYHFGFIKHHSQIYIKQENIKSISVYKALQNSGFEFTREQWETFYKNLTKE